MPILLVMIVGISIFSMTLSHSDADGVTRTGLQGLKVYLVPNFSGMTLKDFVIVFVDALGQLFFSISVAMGIMVTYGSYVKKETNLMRSINQIEWFDTAVALLAGLMIVPAVYTFMGTEGMSAGPGLMFVSLPKIFEAMGAAGPVIGTIFFLMVSFAAVTSSVSVMESIVSNIIDRFHVSRKKGTVLVTIYACIVGVIVCLGYNVLYFELKLPNGAVAQILDLMNQLKKETGTSILFITHDLGVVAEVCDDVAVMYCGRVVERGDVKTIFANPSHPYTKGLLGSIPRLGDAGKELKSIPGNVPNPKYMPKGCKFEPRCPYASEKCREEEPGFFQIEEGHISRCWLCESGQLKTDHVEKAGD